MWTVPKSIIFILPMVVLLALLISKSSRGRPVPQGNYRERLKTGGEIEVRYLRDGGHGTSYHEEPVLQSFGKYEIHYPSGMTTMDRRHPVIVVCNGTGWKASRSRHIYEFYSSWGFIVIGNEESHSWNAFGAEMAIRHLERLDREPLIDGRENIFHNRIDFDNIGIIGHSQGGVGVFNAVTDTDHRDVYRAAVAISPTNMELAAKLEWSYDPGRVGIPMMLLSGAGGGDDWVVTGEGLRAIYDDIRGPKLMMRRRDTHHGDTLYSEDGYVMAWFMWHLQGDEEAARAFTGDDAEVLHNPLYQDVEIDLRRP